MNVQNTEPAARTLRQQVVSGVGWKVATVAVVQVTRIVVGVVLARLLVPRDFGLASMALLFVGVASVFTDLSFGQALTEPYGLPNRASGWCSAQDDDELRRRVRLPWHEDVSNRDALLRGGARGRGRGY